MLHTEIYVQILKYIAMKKKVNQLSNDILKLISEEYNGKIPKDIQDCFDKTFEQLNIKDINTFIQLIQNNVNDIE